MCLYRIGAGKVQGNAVSATCKAEPSEFGCSWRLWNKECCFQVKDLERFLVNVCILISIILGEKAIWDFYVSISRIQENAFQFQSGLQSFCKQDHYGVGGLQSALAGLLLYASRLGPLLITWQASDSADGHRCRAGTGWTAT